MRTFAERILGEFTERHDGMVFPLKNGVPEGRGDIWRGSASYNEGGRSLAEAGDSIAALYQALIAFGTLLESLGEREQAGGYLQRAAQLKAYFNDVWSLPPEGDGYVFGVDQKGRKYWRWERTAKGLTGAETCFFMPMKLLTEPGERNNRLLKEIDQRAADPRTAALNIESYTYLPQVFFPYQQAERAWHWMKHIGSRLFLPHVRESQGRNEDYPELSFTMLSHAIEGLSGFSANLPAGRVATCPCLPEEVPALSIKALQVGADEMDLELHSPHEITFQNHSARPLVWKCSFAGQFLHFLRDGEEVQPHAEVVNGVARSFIEVSVPPQSGSRVAAISQAV